MFSDPNAILFAPKLNLPGRYFLVISYSSGRWRLCAKMHTRAGQNCPSRREAISGAALWILLNIAGNIETNPGPRYKFPCPKCSYPVKSNQRGL